ncbi:unnamed protein product [Porites evermanni]|uniref:Uncharacterized protein n=1 Tax=Porites evermanni TaxID=104178 RepID=A0ABN8SS12_9CNID|nr:unnamed protein product [Porites evermanni]
MQLFFLQRENRLTNHIHLSFFTLTTPVPEQTENIPTATLVPEQTTNSPSSRPSPNAGTKLPTQQNVIKTNDVPEETTGETKLWFLLFLLALIPVIGGVVVCRYWQKRRSRKPERKNSRSVEQKRPLMSRTPRGLDTLVRDLLVEDRRFISSFLNGKTSDGKLLVLIISEKRSSHAFVHSFLEIIITITFLFFFNLGYYHCQLVAEKLGIKQDEIRRWSQFPENPTEKFLAALGEMENGTIVMLIDASKQVELTLFADKLEKRFSQENVADERQTWV